MAVEILEVFVVVEGHVADSVALPLLVGCVHNRVGGVREVNQVTAILQRLHHLKTLYIMHYAGFGASLFGV